MKKEISTSTMTMEQIGRIRPKDLRREVLLQTKTQRITAVHYKDQVLYTETGLIRDDGRIEGTMRLYENRHSEAHMPV